MVKKIISGGQTGADQAALDVAINLGIAYGGWIPKGRITENGVLDEKYKLNEMKTSNYNRRTEQNVIDSDGTLILFQRQMSGGTELTYRLAEKHRKPCHAVDLSRPTPLAPIRHWRAARSRRQRRREHEWRRRDD